MASKGTWEMTAEELAKVWAEHFGYTGHAGGWIHRPDGTPVCQGWTALAEILTRRGWIRVTYGIDWRASGEAPKLPRNANPGPQHRKRGA